MVTQPAHTPVMAPAGATSPRPGGPTITAAAQAG